MVRHHVWLLTVVALIAGPSVAWSQAAWQTYVNPRFGVGADVPAGWTGGTPPVNSDGLVFTSPDGQASLTIWGSFNAVGTQGELDLASKPNPGEVITYNYRTNSSVVVSGSNGGRIFYRKTALACADQVWGGIDFEYPAAQKATFDAIVAHVASSLGLVQAPIGIKC